MHSLRKAAEKAGVDKKVYGVARFSEGSKGKKELEEAGVETIVCDFLKEEQLENLPKVENIIFMVGYKLCLLFFYDFHDFNIIDERAVRRYVVVSS